MGDFGLMELACGEALPCVLKDVHVCAGGGRGAGEQVCDAGKLGE